MKGFKKVLLLFRKLPEDTLTVRRDGLIAEVNNAKILQQNMFDDLLSHYELEKIQCQTHFLKGDASELIPQIVRKKRINLVIMGTVCRTGVKGFLMGNTAETVLNRVSCLVLTIKPDGFVSPVELK